MHNSINLWALKTSSWQLITLRSSLFWIMNSSLSWHFIMLPITCFKNLKNHSSHKKVICGRSSYSLLVRAQESFETENGTKIIFWALRNTKPWQIFTLRSHLFWCFYSSLLVRAQESFETENVIMHNSINLWALKTQSWQLITLRSCLFWIVYISLSRHICMLPISYISKIQAITRHTKKRYGRSSYSLLARAQENF
jgi:hypothetical protein